MTGVLNMLFASYAGAAGGGAPPDIEYLVIAVSYTHLTLPTNREV